MTDKDALEALDKFGNHYTNIAYPDTAYRVVGFKVPSEDFNSPGADLLAFDDCIETIRAALESQPEVVDLDEIKKTLYQAWVTENPKKIGEAMDNAAKFIIKHHKGKVIG